MESLLHSVLRAAQPEDVFQLRMRSRQGTVGLTAELPDNLRLLFLQELQDAYPGTVVHKINSDMPDLNVVQQATLQISPDVNRIRTFDAFLDVTDGRQFSDPIGGLLSAIRTTHKQAMECEIALSLKPASRRRLRQAKRLQQRLNRGFRSSWMEQRFVTAAMNPRWHHQLKAMVLGRVARTGRRREPTVDKLAEPLFECRLVVKVYATKESAEAAQRKLREAVGVFGRFNSDAMFVACSTNNTSQCHRSFLLTAREVATLWHPLTASGDAVASVQRTTFRELEPPVGLTSREGRASQEIVLGRLQFRRQRQQFGMAMDDLRRHLLAIGKTGCGKSTFLRSMVQQQMAAGRGVVLIDPHGQLADEVLDVVPRRRTNDVVYFDASDDTAPVGFNPMVGPPGTDANLIADGVLTSFKNVFGFDDGSAPRLLHIFRNCLLSLIDTPNASLAAVQQILVDSGFRKSMIARVKNPAVREFWLTEFNRWNERDRTQYIASLQNKLGAFTTNERLNRILNCGQQGIQLRSIMDDSQILICNLSKGRFGHDASTLLGSLLLSSLQIAAMSRADVPEDERADCVVVIDEFHSYLSDGNSTMADALAESRKYRTSYVLSTQMLEQLDPATLAGVLGNCGSTLCMTVGPRDAEILAGLLGSGLTPADLMGIPKYHAYLRLLISGAPHTFSMTTLPPPRSTHRRAAIVRKVSRQRYGLIRSAQVCGIVNGHL